MRKFKCCGSTDKNKFSVFWSAAAWVIETDTGTGSHTRLHVETDEETTDNFLYAPNVISIQELMGREKDLITRIDGKKEGVGFLVIYISWVYLQLVQFH